MTSFRLRRLIGLFALAAIAWSQAASAIDLDDGRPGAPPAGPLPAPKDHFAPVRAKPAFLTDEEWAGVQASARASADPAHEQARLVDYLRFQKLYFQWNAEKATRPAHARQLARELMQGLPAKVAQGVVGAEQAEQTLEQLVDFVEPDPLQQERLLARERRRLPPQPSAPPAFGQ
jgi:hypothetical protein